MYVTSYMYARNALITDRHVKRMNYDQIALWSWFINIKTVRGSDVISAFVRVQHENYELGSDAVYKPQ